MIDFAEKTVKELRECAKKLNLPGVSKLKKDELVSALGSPNASDASASAGSEGTSSSDGDTVDAKFSDQRQA